MRKLTTLFLFLFLLGGYSAGAQKIVWQDHFAGCAKSVTYDTNALPEGFPAGTWGPADNPAGSPAQVYIGKQALRMTVPVSNQPFALKGVYVGFAPGTRIVGSADVFSFHVYRVNGNSLSLLGSKPFKLSDFAQIGQAFQVTNNFLDLTALNIQNVVSGTDLIFALDTKTATSDDIINLYYTLPADDAECSKVASNWHVFVNNAADDQPLAGLPLKLNSFFGLDKGASKQDGSIGNPPIFPSVETQAQSTQEICAGGCANLTTALTGTKYQWRPSTGISNPTIKEPQACPRRTTQYIVSVTLANGTITQDTVNVEVKVAPIATVVPNGPTQFCEGGSVDLTVQNDAAFTYRWFRDGKEIANETMSTITVTSSGLYDAEITNGPCVRRSTATYIYVLPTTSFTIDGWPYTCSGGFTELVVVGGAAGLDFDWKPKTPANPPNYLTKSTNGRVVEFRAPGGVTQVYTVSTTNAEGCFSSQDIELKSTDPRVFSAIVGINANQTICSNVGKYKFKVGPYRQFGTLTTVPVLPAGVITPDIDNRTFIINTELITSTINNITFTWAGNFNGCDFSTSLSGITLAPAPKATLSGFRDLVCIENTTPMIVTGSPSGPGTSNTSIDIFPKPTPAAAYTITGTNVLTFRGNLVNPKQTTEYKIVYKVTQGGCTDSIVRRFALIIKNQPATITTPNNGTFCTSEGDIVLTGSPIGGQFTIPGVTLPPTFEGKVTFSPDLIPFTGNETTIKVTYSGADGTCSMSETADLRIIRSNLVLTNFPDDNLFCRTDKFPFTVSPSQVVVSGAIVGPGKAIELKNPPTGEYVFDGSKAPAGKYYINFRLNTATCPPFDTLREITISEPPGQVAILGIPTGPICTNQGSFKLSGVPAGGVFSSDSGAVRRLPNGDYVYYPDSIKKLPKIGTVFTDVITYQGKVGGCEYILRDTITLISSRNPIIAIEDSICADTSAFEFKIEPAGGKFEVDSFPQAFTQIDANTWKIDPSKIGSIHTVTITYSGKIGICDYVGTKKVTVDKPLTQDEITINVEGNPTLICSTGDPIKLTGSPSQGRFSGLGVSYDGNGDAYFDPKTPDVNNKLGIIRFQGRKGGCTFTKFDTLNVFKVGEGLIGLADTVCQGAIVPVIASPSGGTFVVTYNSIIDTLGLQGIYYEFRPLDYISPLSPGDIDTIKVRYYGTLSNGCSYDVNKTVIITDKFTEASITGLKPIYCNSEECVTLLSSPLGGTYTLNGQTNVPGLVDNVFCPKALAPGFYDVTYEGTSGDCSFKGTVTVEVKEAPQAFVGTPDGTVYCVGSFVNLKALPYDQNDPNKYSYQWFLNGQVLNNITGDNIKVDVNSSGYYQVEVTVTSTGCTDKSDSILTNVIPNKLEWDNRSTETFTKGPSASHLGCNDDGYIIATIKERFPGERFEFWIDDVNGPYSSGMNFIELYSLLDPNNPVFKISGGKYKITARDASGCSIDTTLIVLSDCCPMPTELVIANAEPDNGSFNLSWTGPIGVQGFEVQIKKTSDVDWSPTVTLNGDVRDYFFQGLTTGETYCARVRTICEAANDTVYVASKWDTVCITLTNDCPSLFSDIVISNVTASSATITWDEVPTVIGYVVEYYNVDNPAVVETLMTSTNSVNLLGLEVNGNYAVTVKADCGAGNYSAGKSEFFTTLDACPSPSAISVFDVFSKSASASWDGVPGAISYEVRITQDGGTPVIVSSSIPMLEIADLECGASYTVEVRSVCSATMFSDWSGAEFFSTAPCCGSVDNIQNIDQTASTLTFSWDKVASATSYSVTYVNGTTLESKTATAPTNTITLTGLGLNTNYDISIITICGSDSSDAANTSASTNDACPAPLEVVVLETSPTTAVISWLAPTGATSFIVEYELASVPGVLTQFTVVGTKFTLSGLSKGQNYNVYVRTICQPGSESNNVSTDFTTCDVCGEATGVAVSQTTSFSSLVTWTGGICGTTYQVRYRNISKAGSWQTRTTTSNSIMLLSLDVDSEYEVQVRTVCGPSDVSSWSSPRFLRTLNGLTCGRPTNVVINPIEKDRATFFWNSVAGATTYDIFVREAQSIEYAFVNSSNVNTFTLGGLKPGTEYFVKIRANCSSISGDFTSDIPFTTLSAREGSVSMSSDFKVYPNPTRGDVTLSFDSSTESPIQINLVDVTGRVIFSQPTVTKTGGNEIMLPLSGKVTAGMYLLTFDLNGSRQTVKIVVE